MPNKLTLFVPKFESCNKIKFIKLSLSINLTIGVVELQIPYQ